jgi:hypothetical protein
MPCLNPILSNKKSVWPKEKYAQCFLHLSPSKDRVLKEAVQEDKSNRQTLTDLFIQAGRYVDSLPDQLKDDLKFAFPDVQQQLKATTDSLCKTECIIVVAGMLVTLTLADFF